jgi:hypothetical protein
VCMQSSLGRNPRSVHTPFDRAATMTARCEMLLSPGTVISMSIRGARFTRNSIANKKGNDRGCLKCCPMENTNRANPASGIYDPASAQPAKSSRMQAATAQERSCRCKDPSLRFPEGILRHQYTCQGNKDSPPGAVCQGPELHTDNLPSRLSSELLVEEVWSPAVLLAAHLWAELARLD